MLRWLVEDAWILQFLSTIIVVTTLSPHHIVPVRNNCHIHTNIVTGEVFKRVQKNHNI